MTPKMSVDTKKAPNVCSQLLTQEENQKVFLALGKQCTTLSTTVVQLYLTEDPYHSAWIKKFCGVICFVKDCDRRSYFIKLFDMDCHHNFHLDYAAANGKVQEEHAAIDNMCSCFHKVNGHQHNSGEQQH